MKDNIHLASTNTVTQNTETIERVAPIFADKILDSVTLGLAGIQTVPASRDKFAMVEGSVSGMIQNYSDKPSFEGSTTLTDAEFSISPKSIRHEILYSIFTNTKWKGAIADMKNQKLPPEFVSFILDQQSQLTAKQFEDEMWNGNGGLTGDLTDGTPVGYTYVDGYGKLINDKLTAAALTDQIITDAVNDPTNPAEVQAALDLVINGLPRPLINGVATIFVGKGVEEALWKSYSDTQATNVREANTNFYRRYKIQVIPNLNDKRIIAGLPSNLGIGSAFGTGNMLDLNIVDQYSLGQGNFAIMTANYGYGAGVVTNDWVYYTSTV